MVVMVAAAVGIVALLAVVVMMVMLVLVVILVVMLVMVAMLVLVMVMMAVVMLLVVMVAAVVVVIVLVVVVMMVVLRLVRRVLGLHARQQLIGQRHLLDGAEDGLAVQLVPGVVRMAALGFFSRSRATAASSFSWVSFWVRERMMVPADSIWLL